MDLAVFFGLTGIRPGLQIAREGGRYAAAGLGAVFAAIVLNRIWEHLYGPHLEVDPTPLGPAFREAWRQLSRVLNEEVGAFGYLEVRLEPLAYVAWLSVTAVLVALALLLGSRRERLVVTATAAAALALPLFLVAAVMRHTGWELQGRYILAFSVVVPLLAGEIVFRHWDSLVSLRATGLALPFAAIAALVHLHALYENGRAVRRRRRWARRGSPAARSGAPSAAGCRGWRSRRSRRRCSALAPALDRRRA